MLNGAERRAARIGYQVQFAREESLGSMTLTDIDEADIGQWTREKRFDPRARGGIECIERAIRHQPLWPAQTDRGEGQLLLFVRSDVGPNDRRCQAVAEGVPNPPPRARAMAASP